MTKSHNITRLASIAVALLLAAGVQSLALASPAHAAPVGTVKVKTQRMKDASLKSAQVGWYHPGDKLTLNCYKRGQSVKGFFSFNIPNGGWDNLWYKVSDGFFVADVDIETGTLNTVTPACGKPAKAPARPPSNRTMGQTQTTNPFTGDLVGYCTYGAQELAKKHAGYYLKGLTGHADSWDDEAKRRGWTVVADAQPRSIVVFDRSVVGSVGHVAWVDAVDRRADGRYLTITEMNYGPGATAQNGWRTRGFNEFHSRSNVKDVPGMSYILIP